MMFPRNLPLEARKVFPMRMSCAEQAARSPAAEMQPSQARVRDATALGELLSNHDYSEISWRIFPVPWCFVNTAKGVRNGLTAITMLE